MSRWWTARCKLTCSSDLFPQSFRQCAFAVAEALTQFDNVLTAAHVNPDGDAIGSLATLGFILRHLGKRFTIYVPGGLPHYLEFLTMPSQVCASLVELPFEPASAVYVDCSETSRLGRELADIAMTWPTINIDHHICDTPMGSVANFVDTRAAATCQLMAYIAMTLKMPLNGHIGEAIGLGIITDTGNFSHGNTNAAVFMLAAELEKGGLKISELSDKIHSGLPLRKLNLWGRLFQRIQIAFQGKVAWCFLWLRDLEETGSYSEDVEGLVDWLRNINGVEIAFLVRECPDGKCRFSMRSRGAVSVQTIAAHAGGGGHKNAAGGIIDEEPRKTVDLLLRLSDLYLSGKLPPLQESD